MSLAWLDQPLTTSCYAWRLERADGVTIGFVSHDQDLMIDHVRYRAAPGMVPSTIALSDSLQLDSVDIEGVMTSAAIAEPDLIAGRWNGAQLHIYLVNWESPEDEPLHLISGEFGEITRSGDAFRVEVLGGTSCLDEAIAPLTSPTCRARLGDRACKISLAEHQAEMTLTQITEPRLEFADLQGLAADYIFGELRWLSGENCGLRFAIISGDGDAIRLADQPTRPVFVGDKALLTSGCDKNFVTCRDRFQNSINFRGEPYLPGNDLLTRYPGA
ncbi:baseplate hub domain-containing protein [Sphingorhabdus sp. Alg231-15]|uniref:baseplate hub domain-containing protein n=1 Tax=Sphingorhabdus sp. Alg231-15 TaxID=1922222 RepID=UPI000D55955E